MLLLNNVLSFNKAVAALFISISLTACASTTAKVEDHVGDINAQQLLTTYTKFDHSYQSFELTETQVTQIKSLPDDLVIDIYFATWCHDSQREVPRLLKAFANKPQINVNLIGLDYHKLDPAGRAEDAGIKFTPTFIISRNGHELGRIIERPQVDLISDIVGFVQ